MQNNDYMKFFESDFTKNIPGFDGFSFDMKAFIENQTRNMQAITEAQQLAFEGLQTAMQKQGELVSRIVQDNTALAQEVMNESSPEQKLARQTDIMKKVYERSIKDVREIGDIIAKSNQDAGDVLNKRISASLNEIKAVVSKSKPAAKKAA